MIRALAASVLALAALCLPATAQQAVSGNAGILRVLDKQTGAVEDVTVSVGGRTTWGLLEIVLGDCRYPPGNPSGDAWAFLEIYYGGSADANFRGWMVASAPALNALDHPRYDVWVLRCTTS